MYSLCPLSEQGRVERLCDIPARDGRGPRSADDLRTFLRGGKGLKGKPELVEFALCYPPEPKPKGQVQSKIGRIERFGTKGLTVFDPY